MPPCPLRPPRLLTILIILQGLYRLVYPVHVCGDIAGYPLNAHVLGRLSTFQALFIVELAGSENLGAERRLFDLGICNGVERSEERRVGKECRL